MGWRFRHSFKVIPGVRLNLSGSGLSCSIGGAPFTVNVGPRGVYGTASIPGSGIAFRHNFTGGALPSGAGSPTSLPVLPPNAVVVATPPIQEIRSASTELLTSDNLKDFKVLIETTYHEYEDIKGQLDTARTEKNRALSRYCAWNDGFLLKWIFKERFSKREEDLEIADAKVKELEEQFRLTTVAAQVEIGQEQAEPYFRMRDAFASLSECAAIWDIKSQRASDYRVDRTSAASLVVRERVKFSLSSCDLIQWEQKVPHLQNVNGGDLFLYPGFILYRAAKEAFSVIDCHEVKSYVVMVKFQESDTVPQDAQVVGQTWAKANKDGSRDKRFVDNRPIPIVSYGSLTLKSEKGLWEEFQFSNPERLMRFVQAWNAFVSSFGRKQESATRLL